MLEIRNSRRETLQLPVDEKINVEINSTIFETSDILQGSYSYPFSFSLTESNRKFFDQGHRPERLIVPEMEVLVSTGSFQFPAVLNYKVSGLSVEATLLVDLGAVANVIRDTSLREYVTETFLVSSSEGGENPSPLMLANAIPGVFPLVFPVFSNPNMIEEGFTRNPAFVRPTVHNNFRPEVGQYEFAPEGGGKPVIVPMVYLVWLLRHICEKLGFTASGTLFQDQQLRRLIIFNTQSTPGVNVDNGMYSVIIGRHLPDISISAFLKAVRSYLGVTIDVNAKSKRAVFNIYKDLHRMDALDFSPWFVPGSEGLESKSSGGFTIKISRDDNDEMIKSEKAPLLSHYVGDPKKEDVSLEIGTIRMSYEKIVDLFPSVSPMWLLPKVDMPGNLADSFFKKLESSTDPNADINAESDNYAPYWNPDYPGQIPEVKHDFGLRFLLFWGMQPDSLGRNYPLASSVSYNAQYKVIGGLSLQPGEPDDIWTKYQRGYYEFLAFSRTVPALLRLPISVLSRVNPSQPVALRLSNYVFGKYLIEKLTYQLPDSAGYVLAKFEGRQLAPMIVKGNQAEFDRIVWLELRIEKLPTLDFPQPGEAAGYREYDDPYYPFQRQRLYADVVIYAWEDGLYTTPATDLFRTLEYVAGNYVMNRKPGFISTYNPTLLTETSKIVAISGHRTVLETKALIYRSEAYTDPIPFRAYTHRTTYTLKPGEGYRRR